MNHFLQRILIPVILAITALPASAYDFAVDGIRYNKLSDNCVEVTNGPYRGNVIIPEQVTHEDVSYNVSAIGNCAFSRRGNLTSIEIPNSITSIGDSAFNYCESLTSIEIPGSVTKIGSFAFNHCKGLTSIKIPNSVTEIGDCAFNRCEGLTSIELPDSITKIGDFTFDYCSSLTSIVIPNSVTLIGNCAFEGCSSLTSIVIPGSVTEIGGRSFDWCSSLTEISLLNPIPPKVDIFYSNFYEQATLYVPAEAVETYKSTEPWSQFKNIVAIDVETDSLIEISGNEVAVKASDGGIDIVNAPAMARVIVNGIDGRLISAMPAESAELHIPLAPGIYVVKVGSATAKVLVR